MHTPTQPMRHRSLVQQLARYLNESELPFSAPRVLPGVDSDAFAAGAAILEAQQRLANVDPS
jgi:hypothetical protein